MGLSVGFRICASWRSIVEIPELSRGREDPRRYLRLDIATFKPDWETLNPVFLPALRYFYILLSFRN